RTDSRTRLKSRECLSTAPPTTSPSRSPWRPKRATRPSSAAVNISWLLADEYFFPARANGIRFPPTTQASRGAPVAALGAGAPVSGACSGFRRGLVRLATVPHFLSVRAASVRPGGSARGARRRGEGPAGVQYQQYLILSVS